MSTKQGKIESLLEGLGVMESGCARYYDAYFLCFNRQMFYEAHEVLEELWHPARQGPDGDFYKGLIQLAGAFVHLQKGKRDPAARLLRTARVNLAKYPPTHHRLERRRVLVLIDEWLGRVGGDDPGFAGLSPQLGLNPAAGV